MLILRSSAVTNLSCVFVTVIFVFLVAEKAQAQTDDNGHWYVGLFGGASLFSSGTPRFLDYSDLGDGTFSPISSYESSLGTGFVLGGTLGRDFGNNWRGEAEISLSRHSFSTGFSLVERIYNPMSMETSPYPLSGTTNGAITSVNLLGNLWHDFEEFGHVAPYIGGGAGFGVAFLDQDGSVVFTENPGPSLYHSFEDRHLRFHESQVGFAFQLGTGLRTQIMDNLHLDLGYRFRGLAGLDFETEAYDSPGGNGTQNFYSHTVQIGFTASF